MPEVSRLDGVVSIDTEQGERGLDRVEQRFRSAADAATRMSPAIDGVTSSFADGNALINEAVTGLETLNEGYDAQTALANRLMQAQNDLNNALFALGEAQDAVARNTDPAKQQELKTAMIDAQVAVDKQQASVNRLAKEYTGLGESSSQAKISMADAYYAIEIGQKVVDGLGKAFEATIARAAEWGDEMGDLAALTGQSVEDTSRLAATLELVGIKSDQLGRILKAMNDEGINLTVEQLLVLNQRFNALTDPVEKVTFLQDNFKKSWEDMAEVMSRDSAELKELADQASRTGKVIDEETAAKAELFNMKLEQGQQLIDGALIGLGNLAIDGYGYLADRVRDAVEAQVSFDAQLQNYGIPFAKEHALAIITLTGAQLAYADALDRVNARSKEVTVATDDGTRAVAAYGARWAGIGASFEPAMDAAKEAEEYFRKAEEAAEKARQAESEAWLERFNLGLTGNPIQQENERYADSMGELEAKAAELQAQIDKLTASNGQYYETVQGNGATTAQLELANQKLAAAYKKLSEETDPLKIAQLNVEIEKQQALISGADQVVGGYIDNSKKIGELTTEYDEVKTAIEETKEAHELATKQWILDYLQRKVMMDGELSEGERSFLRQMAEGWDLYEGSTLEVMDTIDQSITDHGYKAVSVLEDVGGALSVLPNEKYIDIMVRTHYQAIHQNDIQIGDEDYGGWDGGGGGGGDNNDNNDDNEPDPIVDPDPEPDKPGSVDLGTPGSTGGLGQIVIQIYETGNPQETANAVIEILKDRGLVDRTLVT